MRSFQWMVWSLVCFGLGILVGSSAPLAQATTGSCPTGFCDAAVEPPTYRGSGCARGRCNAFYGATAQMITGTAYGSCGNLTTAASQVGLYQTGHANTLDSGGTNNIMYCDHLDCDAPVKIGYHRQSTNCPCVTDSSFYCIYTLTFYATVHQNGCLLSGFTIRQFTSKSTPSPRSA